MPSPFLAAPSGLLAVVLMLSCLSPQASGAELLLFPEAGVTFRDDPDPGEPRPDVDLGVDLFFAADRGRARVLAEYFWGEREREIERLQLGWGAPGEATVWVGRFHNPLGYWNTQFHHGTFVQTSVSRPGIVAFEHDGGALPIHLTGLLVENWRLTPAVSATLAAGAGPHLAHRTLHALKLERPDDASHKLSTTLLLTTHPPALGADAGALVSHTQIPETGAETTLEILGAFAGIRRNRWQADVNLFYVATDRRGAGNTGAGSFVNGYLQLERMWNRWTMYARVEESVGHENDPYLARFPEFIRAARVAGVRLDLTERQALRLELRRNHRIDEHGTELLLHWSAAVL